MYSGSERRKCLVNEDFVRGRLIILRVPPFLETVYSYITEKYKKKLYIYRTFRIYEI